MDVISLFCVCSTHSVNSIFQFCFLFSLGLFSLGFIIQTRSSNYMWDKKVGFMIQTPTFIFYSYLYFCRGLIYQAHILTNK